MILAGRVRFRIYDFDNLRYQSLSILIALSVYLIYLPTVNPRVGAPFPLPLKPISDFTILLLLPLSVHNRRFLSLLLPFRSSSYHYFFLKKNPVVTF
jgi:hypothetical protein